MHAEKKKKRGIYLVCDARRWTSNDPTYGFKKAAKVRKYDVKEGES